jgi:anti-sigma28 factor (negative regulator of flagellin synthesis)
MDETKVHLTEAQLTKLQEQVDNGTYQFPDAAELADAVLSDLIVEDIEAA